MEKKIVLFWGLFLAPGLCLAQSPAPTATPWGGSASALFAKAQKLFQDKHYQEAKDNLNQLVSKYPMDGFVPKARLLLANLTEDFDAATAQFQVLAGEYAGQPEGAEAQKDMGARYYLADKYPEASQSYKDYLDQYPKNPDVPEVRYWLGSSLSAMGMDHDAIDQFQKVADDARDSPWAPKALVGLGNAHFNQKQYDQAEKEYLKVLQDYPYYDELNLVYYKLGQTFELEKKDRQAYASYQTLLQRFPKALEVTDSQARMAELEKIHPEYKTPEESPTMEAAANPTETLAGGISTPAPEAETQEPTPTAETTPVVEAEAMVPTDKPFHVQVGVFSQEIYVEKARKEIKRAGYSSFVVAAKGGDNPYTYYKVRVGSFGDRASAEKLAKKLTRKLKEQTIVVEDQNN